MRAHPFPPDPGNDPSEGDPDPFETARQAQADQLAALTEEGEQFTSALALQLGAFYRQLRAEHIPRRASIQLLIVWLRGMMTARPDPGDGP